MVIFSLIFKFLIYYCFGIVGNKSKVPNSVKWFVRGIFILWIVLSILDGVILSFSKAGRFQEIIFIGYIYWLLLIMSVGLASFAHSKGLDKRRWMTLLIYNGVQLLFGMIGELIGYAQT